jgi:hypothetical protein
VRERSKWILVAIGLVAISVVRGAAALSGSDGPTAIEDETTLG